MAIDDRNLLSTPSVICLQMMFTLYYRLLLKSEKSIRLNLIRVKVIFPLNVDFRET